VPFFNKQYANFSEARLEFSEFLGRLFQEVACHIQEDSSLADPSVWRKWLDAGTNRATLYPKVLHGRVCGYFYIRIAETS